MSPSLICSPPLQLDIEGGARFRVKVPRSLALHALVDGRVLVRRGAQNRPLGGEEIQRLADAKSIGDFEVSVLNETTCEDFSEELIAEYAEKRSRRSRQISEVPLTESLRAINAVDSAGRATVSGVLTFCDEPQRWLPQSSIVFVKFIGTTPRAGWVGWRVIRAVKKSPARCRAWSSAPGSIFGAKWQLARLCKDSSEKRRLNTHPSPCERRS